MNFQLLFCSAVRSDYDNDDSNVIYFSFTAMTQLEWLSSSYPLCNIPVMCVIGHPFQYHQDLRLPKESASPGFAIFVSTAIL